jgi:DNA-binding PadR family transcriptional regulator
MAVQSNSSPQTLKVLAAILGSLQTWRYAYELSKETKLGSGTLYPLLIRLHQQALLEIKWVGAERQGRPARHAYRLTREGVALALCERHVQPVIESSFA